LFGINFAKICRERERERERPGAVELVNDHYLWRRGTEETEGSRWDVLSVGIVFSLGGIYSTFGCPPSFTKMKYGIALLGSRYMADPT
jgi:hypothetical protein